MRKYLLLISFIIISQVFCSPLEDILDSTEFKDDKQKSWDFLQQYLPERDFDLSDDFLNKNIDYALRARYQFDFAKQVPFDIFLNDVLPYYCLNETRDDIRGEFYDYFSPLLNNSMSIGEAAQTLNQKIWTQQGWNIVFKSDQTPKIMSPLEVIKNQYASCTGLSIFLVQALRSQGIPARVTGTPHWNKGKTVCPHGDSDEACGNHDWVELWVDGKWVFTGSNEYTPEGFNKTWFYPDPAKVQVPGTTNHSIYATSYKTTGALFPMSWFACQWIGPDKIKPSEQCSVNAYDVTQNYLDLNSNKQNIK